MDTVDDVEKSRSKFALTRIARYSRGDVIDARRKTDLLQSRWLRINDVENKMYDAGLIDSLDETISNDIVVEDVPCIFFPEKTCIIERPFNRDIPRYDFR